MNTDDIRRLIQGPIATVPTPFDDDFHVDLGVMAERTQWWVDSGLVKGRTVIKVAAAIGEGPQLRDTEWPALLRTVVRAAEDRGTIVCGLHYKDTKHAVEDARRAQDLGAIALQISPPVFNGPTEDDTLRHYEAISDAIDIGILVYCRPGMQGGDLYPKTFRKMGDFEQVVAIKWGPPADCPYEAVYELTDRFTIIDNRSSPVLNHRLGGRGYIQNTIETYPPHSLEVWDLLEARRYDEAQTLYDSVQKPIWDFYTRIRQSSGGQARVKKGMMAIMGLPMGASRPPSLPLSDEEMAELRRIMTGLGWPVPEAAKVAAA